MNSISIGQPDLDAPAQAHPWVVRVRVVLVAVLMWCGYVYVAGPLARDGGAGRPVVLTLGGASLAGMLGAVAAAAASTAAGAVLLKLLRVRHQSLEPFVAMALAAALWVMRGGTMDEVLMSHLAANGLSPAPVYWSLLGEYLAVAVIAAPLLLVFGTGGERRPSGGTAPKSKVGKGDTPASIAGAVIVAAAVALVVMWILGGERLGPTRHGQVFFATFVGFMAGTYAAAALFDNSSTRAARALLAAPLLAGAGGAIYTAIAGKMPAGWEHLNCIPTTAFVRALPLEMLALGWLGIASTMHLRAAAAAEARG